MKICKFIEYIDANQKLKIISYYNNWSLYSINWTGITRNIPVELYKRKIKKIRTIKNDVLEVELEDK